jgi:hypothetical protein
MTAKTMAEVLGEHVPTASFGSFNMNGGGNSRYCSCGERFDVLYTELGDDENGTNPLLNHKLAAHQAAALSAAGFGLVADAKAEAWDEGWAARAWRDPVYRVPDTNPYRATP